MSRTVRRTKTNRRLPRGEDREVIAALVRQHQSDEREKKVWERLAAKRRRARDKKEIASSIKGGD